MDKRPPRRTRERILELSLRLFNDFGEPNVTTTIIAEGMRISPGNLYYHFRNKDDIVLSLFEQFERDISRLFDAPARQRAHVEDAWLFLHVLFETIWTYRFLYRDLATLLINNRTLELRFQALLAQQARVARRLCEGLAAGGDLRATPPEIDTLARNMVVVSTYWLSYEYVLDPRHFTDPRVVGDALSRGCYQVMSLAAPYLQGEARQHFERLAAAYLAPATAHEPAAGSDRPAVPQER